MKAEEMFKRKLQDSELIVCGSDRVTLLAACIIAEAIHEVGEKIMREMGERGK